MRKPEPQPQRVKHVPGYNSALARRIKEYSLNPTTNAALNLMQALRTDLKHGALGPIQRDYVLGMLQGHLSKLAYFESNPHQGDPHGIQVDPPEAELLTERSASTGGEPGGD